MNLDKATELAENTDYAIHAAQQDDNPINMGDAGAFFLEGYLHAKRAVNEVVERLEKANDDGYRAENRINGFYHLRSEIAQVIKTLQGEKQS